MIRECKEPDLYRVCCAQVVVGRQLDSIFMVMEYMEHDLKGLSENMRQPFTSAEVRWQGLAGVRLPLLQETALSFRLVEAQV